LRSLPIEQFGSGSKIRDYLFVDDFVDVTKYLLDEMALNQTLNIGSGHLVEVKKVIETVYEILKKQPNILITGERSFDKSIVDIDVSEINKLMPFRPLNIYEGLSKYISQLDKNNLGMTD
jgi:nucleoside-diphosphate-sugar epimerase